MGGSPGARGWPGGTGARGPFPARLGPFVARLGPFVARFAPLSPWLCLGPTWSFSLMSWGPFLGAFRPVSVVRGPFRSIRGTS